MHHLYLHGFASSPQATKAIAFKRLFAERGASLLCPDLARPSFSRMTITAQLEAIDEAVDALPAGEVTFVGSSMGGYLAALWASAHPGRVARLALLCPGFDMRARWQAMLGDEAMQRWRELGSLEMPDAAGKPTPVHIGLLDDAEKHPSAPAPSCPTLIVHGVRDEVVPVEVSRRYAAAHVGVRLIEVDDEHRLLATFADYAPRVVSFAMGGDG